MDREGRHRVEIEWGRAAKRVGDQPRSASCSAQPRCRSVPPPSPPTQPPSSPSPLPKKSELLTATSANPSKPFTVSWPSGRSSYNANVRNGRETIPFYHRSTTRRQQKRSLNSNHRGRLKGGCLLTSPISIPIKQPLCVDHSGMAC